MYANALASFQTFQVEFKAHNTFKLHGKAIAFLNVHKTPELESTFGIYCSSIDVQTTVQGVTLAAVQEAAADLEDHQCRR